MYQELLPALARKFDLYQGDVKRFSDSTVEITCEPQISLFLHKGESSPHQGSFLRTQNRTEHLTAIRCCSTSFGRPDLAQRTPT
eukprot:342410-Rhodomonas_salina.1